MLDLYKFQDNLLAQVDLHYIRPQYYSIRWEDRMAGIKGARGTGKTTLMLQYLIKNFQKNSREVLYVTADHYWFYSHTLFETADEFYRNGGEVLLIDEVHKYPNWSRELKNIYDGYKDLRVIFSSSSALEIYKGEADLSRRVLMHELAGLSFREYLKLSGHGEFSVIDLDTLIKDHRELSQTLLKVIKPLVLFRQYLKTGYSPIFTESSINDIPIRLNNIINTVIDTDLSYIKGYDSGTAFKVKRLLGVIAESAPFKPNISSIAAKLITNREAVYEWITLLDKARIVNQLMAEGKGVSTLQKPDKLYLENTNLAYALKENPEIGSVRETFLLNQLKNSKLETFLPRNGDFATGKYVIEVGGNNKPTHQLKNIDNAIFALDEMETGLGNKIPLYAFGFLY